MEMTSGDGAARVPRPLSRRLICTSLGAGPARPDADASDERIVELWLRDRPANTRIAYERDYGRFQAFIGARSLRTVGLGDLSDFAATLTGSAATRRRTLSAIKALLSTGGVSPNLEPGRRIHAEQKRHFLAEVIVVSVRWYLEYKLSSRDISRLMAEREISVDHSTILRWVRRYAAG
jgi:hypothetical protein